MTEELCASLDVKKDGSQIAAGLKSIQLSCQKAASQSSGSVSAVCRLEISVSNAEQRRASIRL